MLFLVLIYLFFSNKGGQTIINPGSIFNFSKPNINSTFFIAFYNNNVPHLTDIKQGYCASLIYSLFWKESFNNVVNKGDIVEKISRSLNFISNTEYYTGVLFDGEYNDALFKKNGINCLKNMDQVRYDLFKQANELLPNNKKFTFHIVKAIYQIKYLIYEHNHSMIDLISGDDSYEINSDSEDKYPDNDKLEVDTEEYYIERWFNSRGQAEKNLPLDLNFFTKIIDPNETSKYPFAQMEDIEIWNENRHVSIDISSYDGGGDKTVTYQKYMLAILPPENH